MGLRGLFKGLFRSGGGEGKATGGGGGGGGGSKSSGRSRRQCMYGHDVPRGAKMCEHRHWVG